KTFIKNNEVNDDVKKRLLWASNNSVEPSIQSLSNYYLGLMALSVNSLEDASRFANLIKSKGFQGFKFDLLGDIAHIEGKIEEARNHYQKAITSFSAQSDFARVIEYKLQNL
ncbi:MAG: tetratricopeptide repeat protein, partial [Methylophilaceae bacterium]